jgi:small subunit ribosomal protein S4
MSRTRSKVRLSRALGIALTPKAGRHLERRPYPPGEHGRGRKRTSDYKARLLEKQRLRAQYDLSEAQLRLALARALRSGGSTGEALLVDL